MTMIDDSNNINDDNNKHGNKTILIT